VRFGIARDIGPARDILEARDRPPGRMGVVFVTVKKDHDDRHIQGGAVE
jgi:hypothetical protein